MDRAIHSAGLIYFEQADADLLVVVITSACASQTCHSRIGITMHDIIDTAVAAGSFTTLATALTTADLISTLKGTGPFTVFAPTDDAFKKLPAGTVEALLKDKAKLAAILTHHVVAGKVMAKDVASGDVKTVAGNMIKVVVGSDGVTVGGAKVTKTDIECTNGVIHIIDTVVVPA
jgi:uncharacterized surface protein with fasciclin (FAS1) repeats